MPVELIGEIRLSLEHPDFLHRRQRLLRALDAFPFEPLPELAPLPQAVPHQALVEPARATARQQRQQAAQGFDPGQQADDGQEDQRIRHPELQCHQRQRDLL